MSYFEEVKKHINLNIDDELLAAVLFEISKYYDKNFIKTIQLLQKEKNIVLDSHDRKNLRKIYYYGNSFNIQSEIEITPLKYKNKNDIEKVSKDCLHRLNAYNPKKIIDSIKQRISELKNGIKSDSNMSDWLKAYDSRRKKTPFSLLTFKLDQSYFKKNQYNENIITDFIKNTYNSLENYRYLAIIVDGEIFDKNSKCITWNLIYKAGIYAENFMQFEGKFNPFHKDSQIKDLTNFLTSRKIKDAEKLAEKFYENISTGYKFEDCYISDNQQYKILIYKKIKLDETKIPCPACNKTINRGNSYPEMFLKSWECANPSCPERSKSGRGKRFDEYGVYRYFKLVEGNKDNKISNEMYQNWRRDIFNHNLDWRDFLVKEYSYSGENIYAENIKFDKLFNRRTEGKIQNKYATKNTLKTFDDLPIVKLYKNILKNLPKKSTKNLQLGKNLEIINDDSALFLNNLSKDQIGAAITSPPYYNAREYSQWRTLIMYYVDMLINCKSVYNSLINNGYYLYNIGDIVSEDNIYVTSNMSKRRIQLGFLSCLIFEITGYNLTGNIIWDKGEVQSKRNSTVNLIPGYVKCVNCYEHVFIFRKGEFERLSNKVLRLTPVIKINNKGENTYKHTAPYPIDLVELIRPYMIDEKLYILDPFLGSGTTLKWCQQNGKKGIGVELNKEYYKLCLKNLSQDS